MTLAINILYLKPATRSDGGKSLLWSHQIYGGQDNSATLLMMKNLLSIFVISFPIHWLISQLNRPMCMTTDACEIEQYLGVMIKMGLVHMPRYQMHRSKELCFPPVADVMNCNRFTDVTRYLHFSDNTKTVTNRDDPQYDRYYKVRPLLTCLRDACLLIELEERMSADEQMIPYKGRNSLWQYIPGSQKMGIQSHCSLWSKWSYIWLPFVWW